VGKTELKLVLADSLLHLPPSQKERFGKLWGRSLAMRRVFAVLERVAPTDAAVVIEGETGTGKDLCAQALHSESRRANEPFVVVDLAGVQPNLIESELFGHVRGAYTGAVNDRAGAFERANGGTLFLDEITALAPELQPRLLRALENRQTKRVGANDYRSFDVRVVAASNKELEGEVAAARFREDLYHRLAVVRVTLPPLRKRLTDLPLLVEKMLESMKRPAHLGPTTLAALQSYSWPGNVRELRNVVERALSLGGDLSELPADVLQRPGVTPKGQLTVQAALPFKEAKERLVAVFERDYIEELMLRCDHNVSKAAREAGIDRVHLHRLLKKHGLG
jgi:DNA-binding NtrC family response regulator